MIKSIHLLNVSSQTSIKRPPLIKQLVIKVLKFSKILYIKSLIKLPPLLTGCSYLLIIPIRVFLLSLALLHVNGHPKNSKLGKYGRFESKIGDE